MFDEYPSPPSTPSSSSRLRSSIPHLHTPSSPLSCPHSHARGQRASKASDIAQLLDPSYSPTRTNAYLSQIYVDHAGEAHDPDFRLFAPAGYSPKRREFLTCESDDDADDDADDEEAASLFYRPPHSRSTTSKRASFDSARSASYSSRRPDSRASDPVYSRTALDDAGYATFTYTFEEQGYVSDDEPRREANKLRRRRASLEHDRPVEQQPEPAPEQSRSEWT